jgi:hypothetical protein
MTKYKYLSAFWELLGSFGLCPSFRWVGGIYSVGSLMKRLSLSKGPNRVGISPPHLRTETDPVSETLCSLVFRIPDDRQSLKEPSNSECYTLSSEPFESTYHFLLTNYSSLTLRLLEGRRLLWFTTNTSPFSQRSCQQRNIHTILLSENIFNVNLS